MEPENQRELLEHMEGQSAEVMARMPGFVSINLHRSLDGARVLNYVQWRSERGLDEAHDDPDFVDRLRRYSGLALEASPRIYDVVYALGGDEGGATAIREGGDGAILINDFKTTPEHQPEAVDLLVEHIREVAGRQPGFRAANLHRSHDGTRVVNYSRWDIPEAYEAARASGGGPKGGPAFAPRMERVAEVSSPDPHLYEVSFATNAGDRKAGTGVGA